MARAAGAVVIKKYGNRRLYDTEDSQYLTQDELAKKIQGGEDVVVVDAKTGNDLTQATLTQLIMESRGASKLLPVPLLTQLIRLGDEALAEFFGRYMSGALQVYMQAKRGAEALSGVNPFATLPFSATSALARLLMPGGEPTPVPVANGNGNGNREVEDLRQELAELKEAVRSNLASTNGKSRPQKKRKRKSKSSKKKTKSTRKNTRKKGKRK